MKSIELYKFIEDNGVEWHKHNNDGIKDVIVFINTDNIAEFMDMVKTLASDCSGSTCVMKYGYLTFWMRDICDYYGIDIDDVFEGDDWC